jgi:hypothetical protein
VELLRAAVPVEDAVLEVEHDDGVARLVQQLGLREHTSLDLLELLDVGAGAEPLDDLPGGVAQRHGAAEHPPVGPVGPAEPVLDLVRRACPRRLGPALGGVRAVVRVERRVPAVAKALLEREPRVVQPLPVEVGVPAVRPGDPHDLRQLADDLQVLVALGPQLGVGLLELAHPVRQVSGLVPAPSRS